MIQQYADLGVSHAKFEREVHEWRQMEAEYRRRGWFLVHAEYPSALVVLASPKLRPPAVVVGVLLDYTNYDAAPPSVRLVDPFTGIPYAPSELPTHLNRAVPGAPMELPGLPPGAQFRMNVAQPLMQYHSPTDIPFLCVAGTREYHEHPGHSGDPWELHRASGAGRLARIIDIVHRYGVEPIPAYNVQLIPQIGFGEGPAPE